MDWSIKLRSRVKWTLLSPVQAGEDVSEEEEVPVPDEQIEHHGRGEGREAAAPSQEDQSVQAEYLTVKTVFFSSMRKIPHFELF